MSDTGLLLFRRWAGVLIATVIVAVAGVCFFDAKAQTLEIEKQTEQVMSIGRLAYTRTQIPSPDKWIYTANPDGSSPFLLPIPFGFMPTQPAWSPDGTKIAWAGTLGTMRDIIVINADGTGQTNLTNTANPIEETNPSWSVTGKIAYERAGQIWVMNSDGTGQAQFSAITQPSPTGPSWSADGMKLAFASSGEIWVINADGTGEHRVTVNATNDTEPAWSPDGSKITFTRGTVIAVINADGTSETPLSSGPNDRHPAWSPDGTKIAFSRDGVYTMNANGSSQIRIVANTSAFPLCCDQVYENPAWQPVAQAPNTFTINGRVTYNNLPSPAVIVNLGGTTNASMTTDLVGNYQFTVPAGGNYTVSPSLPNYYFSPANRSFNSLSSNQVADFAVAGFCQGGKCVRNGKIAFVLNGEIFVINQDGTGQTNITNNPATESGPSWAPDGTRMAFASNRDGNFEIYRMNSEGDQNPTRLTNNSASDSQPNYSPDGTSIVFVSTRDGNDEIYKMNADGTNQVRLTNNTTGDTFPAFSPDGSKIVFVNSGTGGSNPRNIWTMNADGSNPQPNGLSSGFSPSYSTPSYSLDGSKIIYTYTPDTTSVFNSTWTMNANGTNRAQSAINGMLASYSPDGSKVVYTCCIFDNTHRLRTANPDGSSERAFSTATNQSSSSDWQSIPVLRRTLFDFDGDGRSDPAIFRPETGLWWYLSSVDGLHYAVSLGQASDAFAPADYDGDLKTDVAVWRPSTGNFHIFNSFNSTFRTENFGLAGDLPTGGDWDGDGKADLAVYRPGTQGVFYYRGSMGNPQGGVTFLPWGMPGDKSVAGDYDGDGRTDAAVYRGGIWYILQSSNGQFAAYSWGLPDDRLVPADYDGDGRTDPAVYRNGAWYVLRSTQGFLAYNFGISTDTPTAADYDGDGRADFGVFRSGDWWILRTTAGLELVNFGYPTDKPILAAYVR